MIEFWMSLWTYVWYASLAVFSVLSVLVIILGGYDLAALLKSLKVRHGEAQAIEDEYAPPA
jgi:hypothetical protein